MKAETFLTLEKIEMKKTLVALAAVSAVSAFAQTAVTLTGRMDAGYQSINYFGQSVSLFQQNGASTSAIKFTATEELGGGVKAGFMYEIDPLLISGNGNTTLQVAPAGATSLLAAGGAANVAQQTNNATQQSGLTGKGEQYVMISDATLGSIKMGTPNTATLDAFGAGSPFGTAVGSGYGSTGLIFADLTRIEAAAKYESPTYNGLQVTYLNSPKNDTPYGTVSSTSGQTVYIRRAAISEIGLHYVQGPLTVRGVLFSSGVGPNASTTATKTNVTTKTTTIGATYDLGYMKLHGTLQNQLADNSVLADNTDTKAASLGLTYPMGANRLLAKYSTLKRDAGTANAVGQKSTMLGLGLERDLSKNTYVYGRYENAKFNTVTADGVIVNNAPVGASTAMLTTPTRRTIAVGVSMGF